MEQNDVTSAEETMQESPETEMTVETEEPTDAPMTETAANVPEAPAAKIDWFSEITDILETMLLSVFVILLLFAYCMRPVTVDGRSMVPTLYNEDRLVMFRLFYKPQMGDVVVVNNYAGHVLDGDRVVNSGYSLNECIIKRVIATAGHTVQVDAENGALYVDGVLQNEPYINELTYTNDGAFEYPITIPEGYCFVMGDNRNHSTDSRNSAVGLVEVGDVMGKAYFRYKTAVDEETGEKLGTLGFIG